MSDIDIGIDLIRRGVCEYAKIGDEVEQEHDSGLPSVSHIEGSVMGTHA